MDSEEERQKKQIFLQAEILQKGYDGLQFQDFLNSKKSEGS